MSHFNIWRWLRPNPDLSPLQKRLLFVYDHAPDPAVPVLVNEIVIAAAYGRDVYYLNILRGSSWGREEGLLSIDGVITRYRSDLLEVSNSEHGSRIVTISERELASWFRSELEAGRHYNETARIDSSADAGTYRRQTPVIQLIPWVTKLVWDAIKQERRQGPVAAEVMAPLRLFPSKGVVLLQALVRNLSGIADWASATHPDVMRLTFNQALYRSRRWHAKVVEQEKIRDLSAAPVVYVWEDGWKVHMLDTPPALRAEGAAMKHCVGRYAQSVASGDSLILSLRDPSGKPHLTLEFVGKGRRRLVQAKGPCNQLLGGRYRPKGWESICARVASFVSDQAEALSFDARWWEAGDLLHCREKEEAVRQRVTAPPRGHAV